jgi:hypothetical protein
MPLKLAIFLLIAVPAIAAKVPVDAWQTGTLTDIVDEQRPVTTQHEHTYGTHHQSTTTDASYTVPHYLIETDKHVYEVIANGGDRRRVLPVTVNGPLKYALIGTDLYIQDEKGKEHKMTVLRKTLKTAGARRTEVAVRHAIAYSTNPPFISPSFWFPLRNPSQRPQTHPSPPLWSKGRGAPPPVSQGL